MSKLSAIIDKLQNCCEMEEPQYREPMASGMDPNSLWDRYLYLQDDHGDAMFNWGICPLTIAMDALVKSVASIAFLPTPNLPDFPWAPVR